MDDLKEFDQETQARLVERLKFFDGILSGTIDAPPAMTIGMPKKSQSKASEQEKKEEAKSNDIEEKSKETRKNDSVIPSSSKILSIMDKMGLTNMIFDKNPTTLKPNSMYDISNIKNNNNIPKLVNIKSINSKKKYYLSNSDLINLNENGYLIINDFITKTNVFNKFNNNNINNSNDYIIKIQEEINEMKKNGKLKHAGMRTNITDSTGNDKEEKNQNNHQLLVSNCAISSINGRYRKLSCKDDNERVIYINENKNGSDHILFEKKKINGNNNNEFDIFFKDCFNNANNNNTWIIGKIDKNRQITKTMSSDELNKIISNIIVLYITRDNILNTLNKTNWICIGGINPTPQIYIVNTTNNNNNNNNSNNKKTWHNETIRSDLHCWVHANDKIGKYLKSIIIEMDRIRIELNDLCNFKSNDTQCQVTLYPNNGALYKTHIDDPPSKIHKRKRRITCLLYLNDNNNKNDIENKGGCLRMHLPNNKHKDVKPFGGTLVLFNSQWLPHQVMPTYFNRYAITLWFY